MSQQEPFLQQIRNTANVTLDVLLSNLSANIGTAYGQANTAYGAANSAYSVATAAYAAANAAASAAATAQSTAQAAYAAANNGINNAATALAVAEAAYAVANTGVSNSGATAGSYGNGSAIPVFTVDARGRITAVSTTALSQFTSSGRGVVPASGGGTTNFLRADGTWIAPLIQTSQTLAANGIIELSSGLILQWGQFASAPGGEGPVKINNFNTSFPNNSFFVTLTPNGATPCYVNSSNANAFIWSTSYSGGAITTSAIKYFAIGY
jgi:hypothetical protein